MNKTFSTVICSLITASAFSQSPINRPYDPVVLTGTQLSNYSAYTPDSIVGFAYMGGSWQQIPIQVDERELIDIVKPYGPLATSAGVPPSPNNPKIMSYCDPNTYVGADTNPLLDADDELVFMAKDAGVLFSGTGLPTGTIPGSCTEVSIQNTLPGGGTAYVYLFLHDGSLQPGAGAQYVSYTSNVNSVAGWPAHINGANPENTTVATDAYSWHIAGEWISDQLKIALGNNADILDRHKNFFANGTCVRSENTFTDAENAYLVAKAGPIRVIRSVMGANSGPLTQRTHIFYQGRFDIHTDLRVHSIPSVFDAFDYSAAANGMVYRNNLNVGDSAIINGMGTADGLSTTGLLTWEQVKGVQGTLSILHRNFTNINSVPSDNTTFLAYYNDNSSAPASNCTGDGQAWGTGGWGAQFNGNPNPTTDPLENNGTAPNLRYLRASRIVYVDSSNANNETAEDYHTAYNTELIVSTHACTADTALAVSLTFTGIACHGGTTDITAHVTHAGGPVTYAWAHDAGATAATVTGVPAGIYTVTVMDDDDTISQSITVSEPAAIDISVTIQPTQLTANQAGGTYQWFNCDTQQPVPNATAQTLTVPENGTYAVRIIVAGCTDTSACISMYPFGMEENALSSKITLFPNPSSTFSTVSVNDADISGMSYRILDLTGRILQTGPLTHSQTPLYTTYLPVGLYVLKIRKDQTDIKTFRMIKN